MPRPDHPLVARAYRVVEFAVEDLERLLDHQIQQPHPFINRKRRISRLCQRLKLVESFIRTVQECSNHHQIVLDLVCEITELVDELLTSVDSYPARFACLAIFFVPTIKLWDLYSLGLLVFYLTVSVCSLVSLFRVFCHMVFLLRDRPRKIAHLVKKIKSVRKEILDVRIDGSSTEVGNSSNRKASSSSVLEENIVIGLEDEQKELLDRLIGGRKQLEVIPIIGMAGIGKTTLANKLYNHSSVVYQFHIRAWTSVSQSYRKKNLMHTILSSIVNENDTFLSMSEDELGEKLYKCLMGNRYLIVIDDIWDIQAWNDLEMYFPKNENGSRILMTSRVEDVAWDIRPMSNPYYLRFLTADESWSLFQCKVFGDRTCPEELKELGKKIVARCKGLPLVIVVIAGLLAKEEETPECWTQLARDIGSSINDDWEQLMETLALSYNHLPSSLKFCFLYLGSFLEDYEIPVTTLIRSWIAEGFIQLSAEKRLEEVAEEYLLDLINRNLVMIAKRRADGGIKSCYIHDPLRDLCLMKSGERKFVQLVCQCASNSTSFNSKPPVENSTCQFYHHYRSHYVEEEKVTSEVNMSAYKL